MTGGKGRIMCFSAVVYYLSDQVETPSIQSSKVGFSVLPGFHLGPGTLLGGRPFPVSFHEKQRFGLTMSEQELIREEEPKTAQSERI